MNELLSRRIVVKVGTSTLTYENGKLNLKNFENLCKVLSDLQNMGKQVILVSSGAIGVGFGKLLADFLVISRERLESIFGYAQFQRLEVSQP